jgi:Bacterial PH domain
VNEHDDEPIHGLPELLPGGEHILWQGTPDWKMLARKAFHLGNLAIYFGVLMAWRVGTLLFEGEPMTAMLHSMLWLAPLSLAALGILTTLAWLVAHTAVYTITNRRVVMRVGVVLTVTFNIPFKMIRSAALRINRDGSGDIPLALAGSDRISYLHLWPHARPWHVSRPEPMLRSVPDVLQVSEILSAAVAAAEGSAVRQQRLTPHATTVPPSEGRPLAAAQ